MLTVKHISLGGEESLHEARHVVFRPASARAAKTGGEPSPEMDGLEVYTPQGPCEVLFGGTAFVMNDHGKTVSRYDLGASQVPFHPGIDPHVTAYIIRRARDAEGAPAKGGRPIVPGVEDQFPLERRRASGMSLGAI